MNKYVDFVSDEDFLECVKWVCDGYLKSKKFTEKDFHRNTVDPFKIVFDIINNKITFEEWIETEKKRQSDKAINNRIGDFHQKLLGKTQGWEDLGVGNKAKLDLRKKDNSIFIELKNKFNTTNSDSASKVKDKLEKALTDNPEATCYWAYIIGKYGNSGDIVWMTKGQPENQRLRIIWGEKVYELVTGDKKALRKVWSVLPVAISDVLDTKLLISIEEKKKLLEFFAFAFENF